MLFILFGNLEQFLLSLLFMSKAEVICRFSQSGFYTLKSVFNSTAFQQSCQHHLTVPFFSFKKHPSCVCQEFDTSLAWVRKTYGCSIIWNMGNAWEQCSSCFQCYCGDTVLGVRSPTRLPCCSQHGLISSRFCYLALDITAVTLSSLKEELTLLSRAPDSSGSDSSAISSLCVFNGYQNISWYFFCFLFLSCWHLHQDLFRFEVCKVCN